MNLPIRKISPRKFRNSRFEAKAFFIWQWYKSKKDLENQTLVNHEDIHFRQQLEMLFILHWIAFILIFIWNFISRKDTYYDNPFEREAYVNQNNLNYLNERPFWAFLKYVNKRIAKVDGKKNHYKVISK